MGTMWKALLTTLPFLLLGVDGHGNMVWPPIWLDSEGSIGLQPGGQCWAAGGTTTPNCMWFTNFTFTDGEVRLPEWLRTYNDVYPGYDYTKAHPWRSPGPKLSWRRIQQWSRRGGLRLSRGSNHTVTT